MEPLDNQVVPSQTANPTEKVPARRRLIKAGALGATVIMATLASRPALAHTCKSPSAFGSMNISRPPQLIECGYSPGYWKNAPRNHPDAWPRTGLLPTALFNDVFPQGQTQPLTFTLMDALNDNWALRKKVVCALLNLRAGFAVGFLTEVEIRGMWAAASTGQNYVNSTRGINWTPQLVDQYFSSLFE